MKESKFTKLGRERGREVCLLISLLVKDEKKIRRYTQKFLAEFQEYSFKYHRVGEPRHEGCRSWILEIDNVNYENPVEYAKRCKADMDSLQQKDHARRYFRGFMQSFG